MTLYDEQRGRSLHVQSELGLRCPLTECSDIEYCTDKHVIGCWFKSLLLPETPFYTARYVY